jgi:hypothetical protein
MNETRTLSPGERVWRKVFFVLSAMMTGFALVNLSAGHYARAIGDLGASLLMLSLIVQFAFVRAIVKTGDEGRATHPQQRRDDLLQQAEKLRAANPWAEYAGRAGWILLGVSLLLRAVGVN